MRIQRGRLKRRGVRGWILIIVLAAVLVLGIGLAVYRTAGRNEVVIVLDPGHDSTHTGAESAGGLKEEDLNLKIANYCKEELEACTGAKVYLTRADENCPFEGCSEADCLKNRVGDTARYEPTVFVSIHLNWNEETSVSGTQIYIPNENYNITINREGIELAYSIMAQLNAIGLKNAGIYSEDSVDKQYPDGSAGDYWSVIYQSKLAGFPGIIIEHAFLSNAADVDRYLSTEEGLKSLGSADARGIADYLGLDYGKAD